MIAWSANLTAVFPDRDSKVTRNWRRELNAAHRSGYRVSLGERGAIKFTPTADKWQKAWYDLVTEHRNEIRTALRVRKGTK